MNKCRFNRSNKCRCCQFARKIYNKNQQNNLVACSRHHTIEDLLSSGYKGNIYKGYSYIYIHPLDSGPSELNTATERTITPLYLIVEAEGSCKDFETYQN